MLDPDQMNVDPQLWFLVNIRDVSVFKFYRKCSKNETNFQQNKQHRPMGAMEGKGVGGGPKEYFTILCCKFELFVLDLIFFIAYHLCYTHFSGRSAVESSTRGTSLRSFGNAPPVTNVLQQ